MQISTVSDIDNAFQIPVRQGLIWFLPLREEFYGGSRAVATFSEAMRCILLTLVVLIACKDHKPEQPPPPPPPHDGVTLVQPGTAPLQVLRYRLTKGVKTTSELVYDFDAQNTDPAADPAKPVEGQTGTSPTLLVTLETEVEDILADGTAKLRVTVVKTRVRDQAGSQVTSDLVSAQATVAEGVVLTETLAPDGEVSNAHVEDASKLTGKARARVDSLLQSLQHVAMRLPTEPVGIGAIWRERKPLPEGGIRAISEATYTLTSITGTTIGYTSTGRASGGAQTIEEDGMKVEVTNPRGHSDAKGSVDLSRYALEVTAKSTFSAAMTVEAPKGTPGAGSSTVAVTVAVQLTPAAVQPAGAAPEPAAEASGGPAQGAHNAP